jgi:ABC-2 type transport system permease protein
MNEIALMAAGSTPVTFRASARALLRLELADALRSRWLLFTASCYTVVFAVFIWLGLRESSVLGFTGMSRVVLNTSSAIVLVLPLVCLVATCQAIVRGRQSGYFEMFLTQPCRRSAWFCAIVASRVIVVTTPLLLFLLVTLAVSAQTPELGLNGLIAHTFVISFALAWCFIGIGLLVSVSVETPERAIVYALFTWLIVSALHDFALIGVLLQSALPPEVVFGLAAANPVEAARLGLLSVIDPELSVFGPVGFWLANALGPSLTFWTGVAWPASVGSCALILVQRRLEHTDLV